MITIRPRQGSADAAWVASSGRARVSCTSSESFAVKRVGEKVLGDKQVLKFNKIADGVWLCEVSAEQSQSGTPHE